MGVSEEEAVPVLELLGEMEPVAVQLWLALRLPEALWLPVALGVQVSEAVTLAVPL